MKDYKQKVKPNSPVLLKTREGHHVAIPFEGSLGLLALGDVGLILWRDEKERLQSKNQKPS